MGANNETIIYKCLDCGFTFEEYDYERVFRCADCGSMHITTEINQEEYDEFVEKIKY